MTFVVGSDHGGLDVKAAVITLLEQRGATVIDAGTNGPASVDYPDFGMKVAGMVSRGEADQGVLVCGTGIGMSMAANKIPGIRAALVADEPTAVLSRQHNDANVLCLAGSTTPPDAARKIVDAFMSTPFQGGRHERRINKMEPKNTPVELKLCSVDPAIAEVVLDAITRWRHGASLYHVPQGRAAWLSSKVFVDDFVSLIESARRTVESPT